MRLRALMLIGVAIVGCSACEKTPPPPTSPQARLETANLRATCPLGVPNAHVVFDETATGAALVFNSEPDRVRELRVRVFHASKLNGTGRGAGSGHDGKHGVGGGRHGLRPSYLPPTSVTVEDTPEGARLTFTPTDPKNLDALRSTLRRRAEQMMMRCD